MSNKLLLETRQLSELVPYGRNARKNQDTVAVVMESIKQYGFQQPIVINEKNQIIAGHTRFQAARQLKLDQVPVVVFRGTDTQQREYRILDNRVAEESEWDKELLKVEMLNLDLPTGFSQAEIDNIMQDEKITPYAEPTVFECVVECESETQQAELFDYVRKELKKECRVLTI